MKIALIGSAGGIGQSLALLLKTEIQGNHCLWLHDIDEKNLGVALDLSHIHSNIKISVSCGHDLSSALTDADMVMVTAGMPRKKGMDRRDLLKTNANILKSILEAYSKYCPKALLGIITNPIDCLIPFCAAYLTHLNSFDSRKLFGVTSLDRVRAKFLSSSPVTVIGGHGSDTMIPLFSQNPQLIGKEKELSQALRECGSEVIALKAGSGSATLSMAYAAAGFIKNSLRALEGEMVVETAYIYQDEVDSAFFSRPFVLSRQGVHCLIPWGEVSRDEKNMIEEVKQILQRDAKNGMELAVELIADSRRAQGEFERTLAS